MVDKAELRSKMKAAAIATLTAGATAFGAPEVQAAETEMDTEAHTEMYAPNASSMDTMGENDISYAEAAAEYGSYDDHPSYYRSPSEYARAHGLVRDARLSRGLKRVYDGAYINTNVHPDDRNRVVLLPRDMQRDYTAISSYPMWYIQNQQKQKTDMYLQNEHDYGYGRYGHHGGRAGEVVRDVEDVVHGVGHIIRDINHIFGGGRGGRGGR